MNWYGKHKFFVYVCASLVVLGLLALREVRPLMVTIVSDLRAPQVRLSLIEPQARVHDFKTIWSEPVYLDLTLPAPYEKVKITFDATLPQGQDMRVGYVENGVPVLFPVAVGEGRITAEFPVPVQAVHRIVISLPGIEKGEPLKVEKVTVEASREERFLRNYLNLWLQKLDIRI